MRERHDVLVETLVAGHEKAYLTNAIFRYQVDMIVAMLPTWIASLATAADREAAEHARVLAEMTAFCRDWPGPAEDAKPSLAR